MIDSPRNVRDVLDAESDLVRVVAPGRPPAAPPARPAASPPTSRPPAAPTAMRRTTPRTPVRRLQALDKVDLFNLLCIPPPTFDLDTSPAVYQAALATACAGGRCCWSTLRPRCEPTTPAPTRSSATLGLNGTAARNAALYFPRLRQPDPTAENRIKTFVPCGAIAGIMARTDSARGVWKAPAGIDAGVLGTADLEFNITDGEQDRLNPRGINCLRTFPIFGRVVWGARTLRGADQLADEYKYVPVRRLALYIEESLYRGTQWVVFEPNDEPLWAQIRLNLGAFMQNLFRQGAFEGKSPRDAYFVKCDRETTTPNDQNLGRVNILVGFAPLRPAEFVILQIQQIARAQA